MRHCTTCARGGACQRHHRVTNHHCRVPFFALTLFRLQMGVLLWRAFGFAASQRVGKVIFVAVTVMPLLAGGGFAWLLSRQLQTRLWRLWLIGPILLLPGALSLGVVGAFESSLSLVPESATLL